MGQAFRRAAGKQRTTNVDPSSSRIQNSFDRTPPVVPDIKPQIHNNDSSPGDRNAPVMEERDSSYEAMLSQMVGRIHTKPGGKLEMGEAFVVQKTSRPLPKLRNTTTDTGRYEERPVTAGTLNVAQLRHIMRLYQGNTDEHDRPLELKEIAERFRVDVAQLERIFQHVSLPPEDDNSNKKRLNVED
ncbi:unnamed protein product [Amaranthus hypochondriacus]